VLLREGWTADELLLTADLQALREEDEEAARVDSVKAILIALGAKL